LGCPDCRGALRLDVREQAGERVTSGTLTCGSGHSFDITGGIPRFVKHQLNADQARTRDSFGDEWTRLYPAHGHTTPEWQAERDIFLEYTRSLPSEYRGRLVLDAGCGNGRYAKVAFQAIQPLVKPGGFFSIFMHGQGNRALYATNRWIRAWTAKASYRTTWNFCLVLTAMGKVLEKIPFAGPVLYIAGRQVLFFSPDQHNNYDHYSAGFTSFHRKEEIRGWYAGWDDVAVRYQGVASESIYARGARPFTM